MGNVEVFQPSAQREIFPSPNQSQENWLARELALLAENYREEISEPRMERLLRELLALPLEAVREAVGRAFRECRFFPSVAELLALAGYSPEALASNALADLLGWAQKWGPLGRKASGEIAWERITGADGVERVRRVDASTEIAPALPGRTESALCAMCGSRQRGVERLLEAEADPDKYARFRKEFVLNWIQAIATMPQDRSRMP